MAQGRYEAPSAANTCGKKTHAKDFCPLLNGGESFFSFGIMGQLIMQSCDRFQVFKTSRFRFQLAHGTKPGLRRSRRGSAADGRLGRDTKRLERTATRPRTTHGCADFTRGER